MSFGDPVSREWTLPEADSRPIVKKAFDNGINFFDTADVYSIGESERITGRLLKEIAPRHTVVLATKLNGAMSDDVNDRGLSRKHVFEAIDASLKRLDTDYVDLYQIHRFDAQTPLEETLDALDDVVRAGKVRYLGASSMYAWQFMKALGLQRQHGWAPFVSMQNHYNLLYREEEREMIPLCRSEGIGVIPWSPLARGRLAGKGLAAPGNNATVETVRSRTDNFTRNLYDSDADHESAIVGAVREVAARLGRPMAEVAYAWVASRPGITAPIVGITKPEQLDDAVAAVGLKLSPDDVKALEQHYTPRPVSGHQ